VALVFFCIIWLSACNEKDKAPAKPFANSLLWKVEGGKLPHTVYLMGSGNGICVDSTTVYKRMAPLVAQCQALYLPINYEDMRETGMYTRFSMLPQGTLENLIPANDYPTVVQAIESRGGIPARSISGYKPYVAYTSITIGYGTCVLNGLQPAVIEQFKQQGKAIKGLEPATYVIKQLDNVGFETQAGWLLEASQQQETLAQAYSAWQVAVAAENLPAIEQNRVLTTFGNAAFVLQEVRRRAKEWTNAMPVFAKEGSVLLMVNANTMVGQEGLLASLREAGYTLTAL